MPFQIIECITNNLMPSIWASRIYMINRRIKRMTAVTSLYRRSLIYIKSHFDI